MPKKNFLQEFTALYEPFYQGRWPNLFASLSIKERQVKRPNQFGSNYDDVVDSKEIPRSENGLLQYYVMDPASIIVAESLDVKEGDQVLDMCAAPGGKSLILIEQLKNAGELIANEVSQARRERLKKVIQQYIPRDVRDRVRVSGKDGGLFALSHPGYFDKILVDAPCSGERHLLENQKAQQEWTSQVSKKLAQRQYALLTAALLCARENAVIIYSTCSISDLENDQVIGRLIEKKGSTFAVENIEKLLANKDCEKTQYGYRFLPDQCGYGPIYLSKLRKIIS